MRTCFRIQSTTELNQKLTKSVPIRHSICVNMRTHARHCSSTSSERTAMLPDKRVRNVYDDVYNAGRHRQFSIPPIFSYACMVWGQTAKFKDCQYFRLYIVNLFYILVSMQMPTLLKFICCVTPFGVLSRKFK